VESENTDASRRQRTARRLCRSGVAFNDSRSMPWVRGILPESRRLRSCLSEWPRLLESRASIDARPVLRDPGQLAIMFQPSFQRYDKYSMSFDAGTRCDIESLRTRKGKSDFGRMFAIA
jgi:hypothetical protein